MVSSHLLIAGSKVFYLGLTFAAASLDTAADATEEENDAASSTSEGDVQEDLTLRTLFEEFVINSEDTVVLLAIGEVPEFEGGVTSTIFRYSSDEELFTLIN